MPPHDLDQPLTRRLLRDRRGFSLAEILVGMAMTALIGLVAARMLVLVVRAAQFSLRETQSLSFSRKALLNDGAWRGMVWAVQEANAVDQLDPGALDLTLPNAADVFFSTAPLGLTQKFNASYSTQAVGVSSVTLHYFNMASNNVIIESTSPALAELVMMRLTIRGTGKQQKTYEVLSAASLRNK